MLRMSRLTDYATVLLAALAGEPGRVQTAASLAEQTRLAAPTVCKLLKQLQRAALVTSTRGPRGGYQLARPAAQISARRYSTPSRDAGAHRLLRGTRQLRDRGYLPRRAGVAAPEPCHPPLAL